MFNEYVVGDPVAESSRSTIFQIICSQSVLAGIWGSGRVRGLHGVIPSKTPRIEESAITGPAELPAQAVCTVRAALNSAQQQRATAEDALSITAALPHVDRG
ncbi:MAG TPA: hypothetical protein VIG08_17165 [Gemmatimonadales bacterium]